MAFKMPSLDAQFGKGAMETHLLYNGTVKLLYNDKDHEYFIDTPTGRQEVFSSTTILDDTLDKSFALMAWQMRIAGEWLKDQFVSHDSRSITFQNAGLTLDDFVKAMKASPRTTVKKAADIGKEAHKWFELYGRKRVAGQSHDQATTGWERSILDNSTIPEPLRFPVRSCVQSGLDWMAEHLVTPMILERKIFSKEDGYAGTLDWIGMVDGKFSLLDYKSSKGVYDQYRFQTASYKKAWEEETGRKLEQRILLRLGKEEPEFDAHIFDDEDEYWEDFYAFRSCQVVFERIRAIKTAAKLNKRRIKTEEKVAA